MFRRDQAPVGRQVPPDSLEARLGALGRLLERQGFQLPGLCIMRTETGFIVHGPRSASRVLGQAHVLRSTALHGDEVTAEVETPGSSG